jgi:hypothetical protein
MLWQKQRQTLVKIEAAVAALTVMAVETIALVVAGSGGNNRYGGGKQQQKLWGQATIDKMGQAAAVEAETAAVPAAIVAARLR